MVFVGGHKNLSLDEIISLKKKTNQRKGADLKPLTTGDNLFGDRNSIKQRRVYDVSLPISTPKFSV